MKRHRIQDLPRHKRPREKLMERGAASLSDAELVAILLRTGRTGQSAVEVAHNLLKQYPLSKLSLVTLEDMNKIRGIGQDKAATIWAALELGKRVQNEFPLTLPLLDSPQKAVDQLQHIRTKKKEYFVVLYLNARNQLIHEEIISIGTLTASLVHPREVFSPALEVHAACLILAHNHPSGETQPSNEDKRVTQRLMAAGEMMDIAILDHIIVTETSFTSFKEEGWL